MPRFFPNLLIIRLLVNTMFGAQVVFAQAQRSNETILNGERKVFCMRFELSYGKEKVDLEIPDENLNAIRRPPCRNSLQSNADLLWSAVQKFGVLNLNSLISGKRVGLIIETNTSAWLQQETLTLLLPFLDTAASIRFFLTAGFEEPEQQVHDRTTEYIRNLAMCYPIVDCSINETSGHADGFLDVGRTKRGTPVRVDRRVQVCDVLLIVAGVHHHAYAGYTTALNALVPGLCCPETLASLQVLGLEETVTFGSHPLFPDPARRQQPVADDLWEAAQKIITGRPVLSLSTIAHHDQLLWASFGELEAVCAEGLAKCDEILSFNIDVGDYLIVTPGRPQAKETFYSVCPALEMTRHAVHPHGEILFLAACNDGLGPDEAMSYFYELLVQPLPLLTEKMKTEYRLHSCSAYRLAHLIQRQRAVYVKSQLPDEPVRRMHLRPCGSAQALIEGWLAKKPDAKINIFDGALAMAIFPKPFQPVSGSLAETRSVPPARLR